MGTVVSPPPDASSRPSATPFADRIGLLGTERAFAIAARIREAESGGERVIRCNIGEPDFPLPEHIREEVKRQLDLDRTHYCDAQGLPELRETVARKVGARRGLEITPDRVVIFPGARTPIGFAQQAYLNPGDEVVYPTPGYPLYESFVSFVGAIPRPLHLREEEGFAFTGAQLASLITDRTKLIFVNFPSNPTGGVASEDRLEEIAGVIRERAPADARVYSDEAYESIVFDGEEHRSIASVPGMEERTIVVSGVSKTYSWTGGRLGWAVFPTPEEAAVFTDLNINYVASLPPYNQLGARLALESPESEPVVRRMVEAFEERRDVVVSGLEAIEGIRCRTPRGAFYVFPNVADACRRIGAIEAYESLSPGLRDVTSPATLFQLFLLYRYHVATLDRRSFGELESEGEHYLRISIATGMDDLREAVDRIAEASEDREGFRSFVREGRHLA